MLLGEICIIVKILSSFLQTACILFSNRAIFSVGGMCNETYEDKHFPKRSCVPNRRGSSGGILTRSHLALYLLAVCLLAGTVCGTTASVYSGAQILQRFDLFFQTSASMRLTEPVYMVFSASFASSFLFLLICFCAAFLFGDFCLFLSFYFFAAMVWGSRRDFYVFPTSGKVHCFICWYYCQAFSSFAWLFYLPVEKHFAHPKG